MAIIIELRNRQTHAGRPLVHPDSEHVVLANVFGVVKNLPPDAVLNPWLDRITNGAVAPSSRWQPEFWEKQPRPQGIIEGATEVDLVLESAASLVFVEVKMGAGPSAGTTNDPDRNQLTRNLDVGYVRALRDKKQFAVIYVTPESSTPEIVRRIKTEPSGFPCSAGVDPRDISARLHWSSWSAIGDEVARAYTGGMLDAISQNFALDLLAYLAKKGLWQNTLTDEKLFYENKLYRPLRREGSPFIPYGQRERVSYDGWRSKAWTEEGIRHLLSSLSVEDKALLKILADAPGAALQQHEIMSKLPFLQGRNSGSLGMRKAHINAKCKALDCAALLPEGTGSGNFRIHEINGGLAELRAIVIEEAKKFNIPWHLLERPAPQEKTEQHSTEARRASKPGNTKAWYVVEGDAGALVAAFVDAKSACSSRLYSLENGRFIRKSRADGSFRSVFAALIRAGLEFTPPFQPDLVSTETRGLPHEIVEAAKNAVRRRAEVPAQSDLVS